ncbi:Scn11a [Symbiodinium sp. CCMP2456]|nr:Scn11a [Symbiodinium sp. CCMP2456]
MHKTPMASQPVVLLKEETSDPDTGLPSFQEVNDSLRELRSVVNEQFARQKDMLLNLTVQVSEMQLQSGTGRLFRPQVSGDSVPGMRASVDDSFAATPITESMDFQASQFRMPAMEGPTSSRGGHHVAISRHSSDGKASARLSPGEVSELPELPGPGQRESVKSDFYAMQEKVRKSFISAFKEPPLVPGSLCAYRIVNSKTFSGMISSLIFLNLVLLGAEVDASSGLPLDVQLESFYVLNNILVSIFVVEVVLKISAYKCGGFFSGIDRWWNLFDLSIVLLSVLEIVIDLIAQSLSDGDGQFMDISHLRIARFARLVRALRGIRA